MENYEMNELNGVSEITGKIVGAAVDVHRAFGPGLKREHYLKALIAEMRMRDIQIETNVKMPVIYKGIDLDEDGSCRLDIVVEGRVLVRVVAMDEVKDIHEAQLFTYLKTTGLECGMMINFNTVRLKDGIYRRNNKLTNEL